MIILEYTTLGNTDIKISKIGLGTWQFGTKGWGYNIDFTKESAIKIIHEALDSGINLIDTAEVYGGGLSEKIVGEAIKDYDREKVVISTKFMPLALRPSAVIRALKKSLKRLQTDYIDLYLIHWPNPILPLGRTLNHMTKMIDEGLIRTIGISNYSTSKLIKAQQKVEPSYHIAANQVNYSIVKHGAENKLIKYANENKVTIMAYSPLGQGWLTGKYTKDNKPKGLRTKNRLFRSKNFDRASSLLRLLKDVSEEYNTTMAKLALAYVIRQPSVIAIPGAKNLDQLKSNITSIDIKLKEDDIRRIKEETNKFNPRIFF